MSGQREQYRAPQNRPFIRVTMFASDRTPIEGRVVDLSSKGAGLSFGDTESVPLENGTTVCLVFETLLLREPIRVNAIVRRSTSVPEGILYGLQFTDPGLLEGQVPFVLRGEFNRRKSPRARLKEPAEVSVESVDGRLRLGGWLMDLSVDGAGLAVDGFDAATLQRVERVVIRFALPGRRETMRIVCSIRARRTVPPHTFLHLQFEAEATPDLDRYRADLSGFVSERLRTDQRVPRTEGGGGKRP